MSQVIKTKPVVKNLGWYFSGRYVLLALLPTFLIVLYYILRDKKQVMDWVLTNISLPYRALAAQVTSFGPFKYFSLAEVLITLLLLWVLFFIAKTIVVITRYKHRLLYLRRRFYTIIVIALYIVAANFWIWDIGYRGTNFGEETGLNANGITVSQLADITELFAEKANELSTQVKRDENKHFDEDRQNYFAQVNGLYSNVVKEFPGINGETFPIKPMIYSKLMSACGFSGVYIALTGEVNINIDSPSCLIPSTIAHEMVHQRGVNSEDEANFFAIAACITSNIPVYEYSGYLLGLTYLANNLNEADPAAFRQIISKFNADVIQDWNDIGDYWINNDTSTTETVTAVYDGYLKSNGIAYGVNSYGACIDMLVLWFEKN